MRNKLTWFSIVRKTAKTINEMSEKQESGNRKGKGKKETIGLTRKELDFKTFRFNEEFQICNWVNNNNIEVVTIATDGNRTSVFYWETVMNN